LQLQTFSDFLTSTTCIKISGRGVNPSVKIEPPDILQVGVALANDTVKKVLTLTNTSSFDVTYTLQLKRDGERNYNRVNPFMVIPCEVCLSAGETKEIAVLFTPDHEHYNYFDTIVVESNNTVLYHMYDFNNVYHRRIRC
jgi:hypothetical protein